MPSFDATEALDEGDDVIITPDDGIYKADSEEARNANGTKLKPTRWS